MGIPQQQIDTGLAAAAQQAGDGAVRFLSERCDALFSLLLEGVDRTMSVVTTKCGEALGAIGSGFSGFAGSAMASLSPSSSPAPSPTQDGPAQGRSVSNAPAPTLAQGEDLTSIASNRDRIPEIATTLQNNSYDIGNLSAGTSMGVMQDKSLGVA